MTAEIERLKTKFLAQEAEIARLQAGFDELKGWACKMLKEDSLDEFAEGFDECLGDVISRINRITGAESD